MYILSIDTSFYASVSVSYEGKILSYAKTQQKSMQSESITMLIERCLGDAKIDYSSIEVVGLNIGIGSFAGIRVGLAAANSIVISNKKVKMCEVNYFDLLSNKIKHVKSYDYIVVISEYTKINSVLKIYKNDGESISDFILLKNDDLLAEISKLDGVIVLCGSGIKNLFFQIDYANPEHERFVVLPRFI